MLLLYVSHFVEKARFRDCSTLHDPAPSHPVLVLGVCWLVGYVGEVPLLAVCVSFLPRRALHPDCQLGSYGLIVVTASAVPQGTLWNSLVQLRSGSGGP